MAVTVEPASHELAGKQFRTAKIEFDLILRDDGHSVLFVAAGKPMTAWREERPGGRIVFYVQSGFAAFPHPYVRNESE